MPPVDFLFMPIHGIRNKKERKKTEILKYLNASRPEALTNIVIKYIYKTE